MCIWIGRYYEAYYVEISNIEDDNKTLSHHTIPYFIPVMSYFESYLAGKLHVRVNFCIREMIYVCIIVLVHVYTIMTIMDSWLYL